jgi:extradiol dioxygenase family protein
MPLPFHLAFHVTDLNIARAFYGRLLGCAEGRSASTWVDFDFFGHQISLHLGTPFATADTGLVGDRRVPMPHFGALLTVPAFEALAARHVAAGVAFVIPPTLRFAGQPGEQWPMFLRDPFGNPLEFKAFPDPGQVFAR